MSKSLVQSQFGAHAEKYVTSVVHAKGKSLARLVELAAPKSDWKVLDVATAAGHTALAFAPHVAAVVASDLTPQMLEQAEKLIAEKGIGNVTTARADAEALPFDDASFDAVTCRIAPHHFPNISAFLSEARRVLKPGGVLAIVDNVAPDQQTTPGFSRIDLHQAAQSYNAFEKIRDPSHGRALTIGEWLEMIEDVGFKVRHVERMMKDMAFQPWAERLGAGTETIAQLRGLLDDAVPALAAYLTPRLENGELWFTLQEGVFIADKVGA